MVAVINAYLELRYLKRMRDDMDLEDNEVEYLGLSSEAVAEYNRRYNYFSDLVTKVRNYLWNISPEYRDNYSGGEFDSIMAVF